MRRALGTMFRRTALCAALAGCSDELARPTPPTPSACPTGWVAYARGECGPAVWLCAPGGGARSGACDGVDIVHLAQADEGHARGFTLRADGVVGGAWPDDDATDGPPTPDWRPMLDPTVTGDAPSTTGIAACAEGWMRDDGACDPMLRADCPAGSEALPGGACTPTADDDCPASEWPAPDAGERAWYVRAGAAGEADGTAAHPFATIAAALARAKGGDPVLVAAGTYREALRARDGDAVVRGVCAARVRITGTGDGLAVDVAGVTASLSLRGVTIAGGGVDARDGATLRAERVVLDDNLGRAMVVEGVGTRATFVGGVVRGTRQNGDDGPGTGVLARDGAALVVDGVALVDNAAVGVAAADPGTVATVSRTMVRGGCPHCTHGAGVSASHGAAMTVDGIVARDNAGASVMALDPNTTLTVTRSIVRDTVRDDRAASSNGVGLVATRDAHVEVRDCLFLNSVDQAVLSIHAEVSLRDSAVRGPAGQGLGVAMGGTIRAASVDVSNLLGVGAWSVGDGSVLELDGVAMGGVRADARGLQGTNLVVTPSGVGLAAQAGGTIRARRTRVTDCASVGATARGEGSAMELTDVAVRRVCAGPVCVSTASVGAAGVLVDHGATLRAEGLLVDASGLFGVAARDPETTITLARSVVQGTCPRGTCVGGAGVIAQDGAAISASAVRLDGNGYTGVVSDAARVSLEASVVQGASDGHPMTTAVGLVAANGGAFDARTVLVLRCTDSAVVSAGAGSVMTVTRSVVRDTRADAATEVGNGLRAQSQGVVRATAVRVAGSVSSGVSSHSGGRIELVDVVVRDTRSGADGNFGRGLNAQSGSTLLATSVLVDGAREFGVFAHGDGTSVTLTDTLVSRVDATPLGYGAGVFAAAGASITADRLAARSVYGLGVAAVPVEGERGAARVTVRDLWQSGVLESSIAYGVLDDTPHPAGPLAAYVVYVGPGATVDLTRALLDDGGEGIDNAAGELRIHGAVITRQRVRAGTIDPATPAGATTLVDVVRRDNADDSVRVGSVAHGETLPALPSPTDPYHP